MPSKHANAGLLIRRGLYDNLQSFTELEQRISALGDENSKAVGDAFEVFVEAYLATHQKLQAEAVWLVGQLPQGIREQMNLPNDAKGIDGIFRTRTGVLVPYQVKFRSQRAYLTYTQIAPAVPSRREPHSHHALRRAPAEHRGGDCSRPVRISTIGAACGNARMSSVTTSSKASCASESSSAFGSGAVPDFFLAMVNSSWCGTTASAP
jgi:hypothetical protein